MTTCSQCSAVIVDRKHPDRKYCSRECQAVARRVPDAPSKHALWQRYRRMIVRCTYPQDHQYHRYGGRGITVCQRWIDDFWAYAADLGEPPRDGQRWTVERINNDGPYAPDNCRWATYLEQRHNRDDGALRPLSAELVCSLRERYALGGITATDLAKEYGLGRSTVTKIVTGKSQAHLGGPRLARPLIPGTSRPVSATAKLTPAEVCEIRRLVAAGITQTAVAAQFGRKQGYISDIVLRKIWKDLV